MGTKRAAKETYSTNLISCIRKRLDSSFFTNAVRSKYCGFGMKQIQREPKMAA